MTSAFDSPVVLQAWNLLQLAVVAGMAGWTAERLLDTGMRTRGLPFLSGLFGLYVGQHLLTATGWSAGPEVAGQPLLAAFAGAIVISGFLKLATLGAAGARW